MAIKVGSCKFYNESEKSRTVLLINNVGKGRAKFKVYY